MSVKSFVGAAKKQDAKKALGHRPVLVLFYMIGCSHCAANKPAWDDAKTKVSSDTQVLEIEADATPDDADVSGFPTMMYVDKSGRKTKTSGQKTSGGQVLSELGISQKGSNRRRSLRRTNRRRNRKLRHRTLRNYISL
jgi:hypothetical protein